MTRALAERAKHGAPGEASARAIAGGDGWRVSDVICTSGPRDRPFEEQHTLVSLGMVIAGSFQYRSAMGLALMTPGSVLLGNAGQCFECGHEHGAGDRCLSFQFAPDLFERIASDAGARGRETQFHLSRLPALRDMAPLVARACGRLASTPEPVPVRADMAGISISTRCSDDDRGPTWEELAILVAARTMQLARGLARDEGRTPPNAMARVTRIVRAIEHAVDRQAQASLSLASLAQAAGLSPFHFLRTFERITGVTPHQYLLRVRLREAALRIAGESTRILDIALESGFGDVSNFNRTFRAEFGMSPRAYRARG